MANLYLSLATIVLVAVCAMPPKVEAASCTISSYSQISSVTSSCTSITVGSFSVPAKTTLIFNLKQGATMTFTGTINFKAAAWSGYLMEIIGNKVTVSGSSSHLLNGNGQDIWDGKGLNGGNKPTFMYLKGTGSTFKNLHLKNCPARCVAIDSSENVSISGFKIDNSAGASGTAKSGHEGHNTDGFDIDKSTYVTIKSSTVINQDDCVAINGGSHITVDSLTCTGSHGFDIAAGMSSDYSTNVVQNVTFSNSVLKNVMYGLHILTCNDGGKGKVDSVTYKNIKIQGASDWGIVIQQDFSNEKQGSTNNPKGNVPVSNVKYQSVTGTMNGQYSSAMVFRCASGACTSISGSGVSITGAKKSNECTNIKPSGFSC